MSRDGIGRIEGDSEIFSTPRSHSIPVLILAGVGLAAAFFLMKEVPIPIRLFFGGFSALFLFFGVRILLGKSVFLRISAQGLHLGGGKAAPLPWERIAGVGIGEPIERRGNRGRTVRTGPTLALHLRPGSTSSPDTFLKGRSSQAETLPDGHLRLKIDMTGSPVALEALIERIRFYAGRDLPDTPMPSASALKPSKRMSIGSLIFITIWCLGFGGIGGTFCVMSIRDAFLGWQSTSWPEVEGRILESRVQESRGTKGRTNYSAAVLYSFSVDGAEFTSTRIDFSPSRSGLERARDLVEAFPEGSIHRVRYNSKTPDEAVLRPGVTSASFLTIGLTSLFPLIAGAVGFFSYRSFFRQRAQNRAAA